MFVTLTAPSFGPVHTRRARRRTGSRGAAGRGATRRSARTACALSCGAVHDEDDPCLGEPLCPECFDYAGAVVWNNALGELWRRTTIYLPRALARLTGMTQKRAARAACASSYVKVAEYQRRGLVHLHVVIRLDRAMPAYRADELNPPPARFDVELLEDAIRAAVDGRPRAAARRARRRPRALGRRARRAPARRRRARGEIAGYLAKYATKSTEQAGGVLHRIAEHQVDDAARARARPRVHARGLRARRRPRARRPALRPATRTRSATAATA